MTNLRKWYGSRANTVQAREGTWNSYPLVFKTLFEMFRAHHAWPQKDGACFCPMRLLGGRRQNVAVERVSMIVFDLDGAQSYDEVKAILEATGAVCWLYTTYSHLKTSSPLRVEQYRKWAERNGEPEVPTVDSVSNYYAANANGHVVVTGVNTSPQSTPQGASFIVAHEPVEKMRVVFPFDEPFIMMDQADNSPAQIRAWKARYLGIAKALKLVVDYSCTDPCRTFYVPSHPIGAKTHRLDFINFRGDVQELLDTVPDEYDTDKAGKFLNWREYPPVDSDEIITDGKPQAGYAPNGSTFNIRPNDNWLGKTNLESWCKHHGKNVGQQLLELILSVPDVDRGPRGADKAGNHIACPFEDEHTTFGSKGTFFDPGGGDQYFKVYCQHNHCTGRRTEEFLARMGGNGWLNEDDLNKLGRRAEGQRLGFNMHILEAAEAHAAANPSGNNDPLHDMEAEAQQLIAPEQRDILEIALRKDTEQWATGNRFLTDEQYAAMQARSTCDSFSSYVTELEVAQKALFPAHQLVIMLAVSSLPVHSASTYFKQNYVARKITLLPAEFKFHFLQIRNLLCPLGPALTLLVQHNVAGEHLARELQALASYYGMAPAAMRTEYTRISRQNKSTHQLSLEERASVYDDMYAKVIVGEGVKLLRLDTLAQRGAVELINKYGGYDAHSNDIVSSIDAEGKPRETRVFRYWFEDNPSVVTYKRCVCAPPGSPILVSDMELNTWVGFTAMDKQPVPSDLDCSPINDHIRDNLCRGNLEYYHWFMTWIADLVQNPGRKGSTAVIITGLAGTGKSLIFEHGLHKMLAPYVAIDATGRPISGNFNSEMENKLLWVSEEGEHGGDAKSANLLKQFISGTTQRFEKKGQDGREGESFLRFAFVSNLSTPVRLDNDDRRYMVLHANPKRARDTVYFQAIRDWLDNGGRVKWYHYLKQWNPAEYNLTFHHVNYNAPVTEAKLASIRTSATPAQSFWRGLALFGEPRVGTTQAMTLEKLALPIWNIDDPWIVPMKSFDVLAGLKVADDKPAPKLPAVEGELTKLADAGFPWRKKTVMVGKRSIPGIQLGTRRELLDALLKIQVITQAEHDDTITAEHGQQIGEVETDDATA